MKKLQNSRAAAAALAVVFFIAGNAALSAQALNTAIKSMSEEIARSVPQDSAIAILGVDAPAQNLSNYIVNELTGALIRAGRGNNLSIVDRQETDQIRAELNFQESGEVSEESAQMMGQTLGASAILTGTMLHAGGDAWQLTFRVIAIDTRRILSLETKNIRADRHLTGLAGDSVNQNAGEKTAKSPGMYQFQGAKWALGAAVNTGSSSYNYYTRDQRLSEPAVTGSAIFGASAWLTRIFSKHFGLQAGAELILANGFNIISNESNVSVLYHNLKIPVLARWNWRPGNWLISPSVGAGLMLRLGEPDVLGMDTDQFEWPAAAFCIDLNFIAGLKIANGYLFAGMNSSTSAGSGSVYYPGNYNLELNAVETTFKIGYELWF